LVAFVVTAPGASWVGPGAEARSINRSESDYNTNLLSRRFGFRSLRGNPYDSGSGTATCGPEE
jgi:hypothetical protein